MTSEPSPRISVKDRAREIEARRSEVTKTTGPNAGLNGEPRDVRHVVPSTPTTQGSKFSPLVLAKSRSHVPEKKVLLGVKENRKPDQQANAESSQESRCFLKVDSASGERRCSEGDLIKRTTGRGVTGSGCKPLPPTVPPRLRRSSYENGPSPSTCMSATAVISTTSRARREPSALAASAPSSSPPPPSQPQSSLERVEEGKGSRSKEEAVVESGPSILGSFKSSGSGGSRGSREAAATAAPGGGGGGRRGTVPRECPTLTPTTTTTTTALRDDVEPAIFSNRCRNPIFSSPSSSRRTCSEASLPHNSNSSPLEDIIASLERICDEFDSTGRNGNNPRIGNANSSGVKPISQPSDGKNHTVPVSKDIVAPTSSGTLESGAKIKPKDGDAVFDSSSGRGVQNTGNDRVISSTPAKCTLPLSAGNVLGNSSVNVCVRSRAVVGDDSTVNGGVSYTSEGKVFVSCALVHLSDGSTERNSVAGSKVTDTELKCLDTDRQNSSVREDKSVSVSAVDSLSSSTTTKQPGPNAIVHDGLLGKTGSDRFSVVDRKSNLLPVSACPVGLTVGARSTKVHPTDASGSGQAATNVIDSTKVTNQLHGSTSKSATPETSKVIQKPSLPAYLSHSRRSVADVENPEVVHKSQRSGSYGGETNTGNRVAFNIEEAKSILAGLDFGKYRKRRDVSSERSSVTGPEDAPDEHRNMESSKTGKSTRLPKSSSTKKFRDFLDSLKPQPETTPRNKKKGAFLSRTTSFTNSECSDEKPAFYLSDDNTTEGEVSDSSGINKSGATPRKTSTLPRRKSPSHRPVKSSAPPLVTAVNSCPSIVKLQSQQNANLKQEPDEGLVSDSETGSGAYVKAYTSCVTSPPIPRRKTATGHVRSCSDDVTASKTRSLLNEPEPELKSDSSIELNPETAPCAPDKRKRRKGIASMTCGSVLGNSVTQTGGQEPVKSGTGRSLTYPPQRKTSVPELGQDYTSVDSNGLKSLKSLSPGLMDASSEESRHVLSDLSLADSHLCPSEGTAEETYQDVVDSVMRSPDDKLLSVEQTNNITGNGKLPKKKHHSDPGGDISSGVAGDNAAYMADVMGSSRSEPDLGLNDTSSCSSPSSNQNTSSRRRRRLEDVVDDDDDDDDDEDGHHLRLVVDTHGGSEPPGTPRVPHGSRHVRVGSSGSITSSSRFNFDFDSDNRAELGSSKSPQEQRRYSKRRLRGPYGEMLEEEMRKYGEKQKSNFGDLSFLQEICESVKKQSNNNNNNGNENSSAGGTNQSTRPSVFSSSQSLDDGTIVKSDSATSLPPKRKISANYPLLGDNGNMMDPSNLDVSPSVKRSSSSCSQDSGSASGSEQKVVLTRETAKDNNDTGGLSVFEMMLEQQTDTRTHVVAELYDTEKSYVESLQILVNKYMKPLKSSEYSGIIDTGLVDEIFFQIPDILSHHEEFLEELRQRLTNWDSKQKVGDVFVEAFTKQEVIDTYTAFINNWKSAKDAIKIASQGKPAFARFLEHMTREHKGKLTLDALLIMPVQRIPRYELLIKELLKHTLADHPDHRLLVAAQREVHELALKINRMEREALQQEQMQQRLKDIEQLIDGVVELVQPDRGFIRHDMVNLPGSLGTRKERCLFLFTDLLLVTSMKRKSGTMRKPSSSSSSGSPNTLNSLEMNKYKLLTKFSLDNLDITKSTDNNCRRLLKDIENLEEDAALLNQISELSSNINSPHQLLDEAVKELLSNVTKQLSEKQNTDSQLVSLELTVTSQEGVESLTILFSSPERRATWEAAFNEAKQKLALCTDRRPPPEFMHPLPIRKTRAGLQFTCAASTLGLNQQGLRDVWVCNSDGYVGQVCVLSLLPEPTVMSCNGVCNSRILTIASIPAAAASGHLEKNRWRPIMPDNLTGVSIEVEECDEDCDSQRTNNGNIELDSDSSDDEDESESPDDEKLKEGRKQRGGSIPREEGPDDMDHRQPTMWLGTEDGCILLYNCNDNIRTKKNKIKIQHPAAIHCIIYLDNKVFVALSNGEVHIYKKELSGGWSSNDPEQVNVGSITSPVTKMLAVAGKLWCGCQNMIKVVNTTSLQIEHSFTISNDSTRAVLCMATAGLGVWVALQHSAVLRLFHATSYEALMDVNVAPAVTKMLSGCDDIIRQHKAACLRVTAMLACKDLLWVGTSAGVILTLPLPHLTSTTARLDSLPNVAGLPHGHTGHVRFLTCVEMSSTIVDGKVARSSRVKDLASAGRRASTATSAGCKLLVISGGDGYEDFRNSGLGESAGRDDSTNHLLLWQV